MRGKTDSRIVDAAGIQVVALKKDFAGERFIGEKRVAGNNADTALKRRVAAARGKTQKNLSAGDAKRAGIGGVRIVTVSPSSSASNSSAEETRPEAGIKKKKSGGRGRESSSTGRRARSNRSILSTRGEKENRRGKSGKVRMDWRAARSWTSRQTREGRPGERKKLAKAGTAWEGSGHEDARLKEGRAEASCGHEKRDAQ